MMMIPVDLAEQFQQQLAEDVQPSSSPEDEEWTFHIAIIAKHQLTRIQMKVDCIAYNVITTNLA